MASRTSSLAFVIMALCLYPGVFQEKGALPEAGIGLFELLYS